MPCRTVVALSTLLFAVVAAALSAAPARGDPTASAEEGAVAGRLERRPTFPWHGPIEIRETWLLTQPRLSLPATSADVLAPGCTRARFVMHRGNDFGWSQNEEGEDPTVRRFLVDGEHQTTAFELRRGLVRGLDAGVRVPVMWRGAGFMDGIIDVFHESTGTMDNIRHAFDNDRFRIEGQDREGNPFSWNDERGVGLGPIEVDARLALGCCAGGSLALAVRASLPTGSGPYRFRGGVDVGAQLLYTRCLAPRWRLHAGVGVVRHGDLDLQGLRYERWRPSGFAAIELRLTRRILAILQTTWTGGLIENVDQYPALHAYVDGGIVVEVTPRMSVELLMRENLTDQQSTTDVSFLLGLVHRF
jgi:hypothetical protein